MEMVTSYTIYSSGKIRRIQPMNNNYVISQIKKELETICSEMIQVMQCLEVLENSLYFASERKDKDITKACAATTEVILNMIGKYQEQILDLSEKLGY